MVSLRERIGSFFANDREKAKPTQQQGSAGFIYYGGYVNQDETNSKLLGAERWRTAADILRNISIVGASVQFMTNIVSRPKWSFEPADESKEAEEYAKIMSDVLHGMDSSWTRIVRRACMYRFHGFNVHEWVVQKGDDGRVVLKNLYLRPAKTISRWDLDDSGEILGITQTNPNNGREQYIPREKLFYLVSDTMADNPEGLGWFRQLVDPAEAIKSLLNLERIGYERDLRGIPVGRAPITQINKMVEEGKLTNQQATDMVNSLKEFTGIQRKTSDTGIVFDSQPYISKGDANETVTSVMQWGIELVTGEGGGLEELNRAIKRLQFECALIIGTEMLLTGRDGEGSRALSEDKSRNLYLSANSITADMAEAVDRDIVNTIWKMNGYPEKMKPKAKVEDVSFKDAKAMAETLSEMATSGAILAPDDPAFDEIRELLGLSPADPIDPKLLAAMQGLDDDDGGDGGGGSDDDVSDQEEVKGGEAAKVLPFSKTSKPLYLHRKLRNAQELIDWAKSQGLPKAVPPEEMHVTIAFSRDAVEFNSLGSAPKTIRVKGGKRILKKLGDDGDALVLAFESDELHERWQDVRDKGASWDWPSYQPHVTLSYDGADVDISGWEPFEGDLIFDREIAEPRRKGDHG